MLTAISPLPLHASNMVGGLPMIPLEALTYSFLFGLLHGILPDEHTWPILFSYAIGGASGKEGIKAGLYFSAAFTVQRMLISELAYLALTPFLLSPTINAIVYAVVGLVMAAAGAIVLRKNRYPHLHLAVHGHEIATSGQGIMKDQVEPRKLVAAPPPRWTIIHGFIAGFGFGGFSLFINTVAAPAMSSPWLGFLPGLLFGLGTMIILVIIGGLFGTLLQRAHSLTMQEIKRIGAQTGGRTLFFGGLLFGAAGMAMLFGLERYLRVDTGYLLIGLFMITVAIPAFIYSSKEVLAARKQPNAKP
jgi:sulfite exporter TauE/SafE